MAGETTSFFANSIFSGLNKGLQGRRALKEEERLKALSRQQAAEDRANKIADYQQEQEIAQNIKNRALADKQEQMINTAALLGRETNNPDMVYDGIAKAYGLGGFKPAEKAGTSAHNSRGVLPNLKAIKSDDRLKKLQTLKAFIDYRNSVSETQDEFGNIIPAKLSPAHLYELDRYGEMLAEELYGEQTPSSEQPGGNAPEGTTNFNRALAILLGSPGGFDKQKTDVSAPPKHDEVPAPPEHDEVPDLPPETLTYTIVPSKEPTIYGDVANVAGKMHDTFADNLNQGRRAWGNVLDVSSALMGSAYDASSAPTTPEEYSRLSALQKIIYKFTGKNISPKRLEQILNKER